LIGIAAAAVAVHAGGRSDFTASPERSTRLPWGHVLDALGRAGVKRLMVEGGARVIAGLLGEHHARARTTMGVHSAMHTSEVVAPGTMATP